VKPGNILLDHAGRPKLADFGLAKRLDERDLSVTQEGRLVGTPAYMAPEQAASDPDAAVRFRAVDLSSSLPRVTARAVLERAVRDSDALLAVKSLEQVVKSRLDGFGDDIARLMRSPSPIVSAPACRALVVLHDRARAEGELARLLKGTAPAPAKVTALSGMARGWLPPMLSDAMCLLDSPEAAAAGPLREQDVVLEAGGGPVPFGDIRTLPAGEARLLRKGKAETVTLAAPASGLRLFTSYVVLLDGVMISRGDLETAAAQASPGP